VERFLGGRRGVIYSLSGFVSRKEWVLGEELLILRLLFKDCWGWFLVFLSGEGGIYKLGLRRGSISKLQRQKANIFRSWIALRGFSRSLIPQGRKNQDQIFNLHFIFLDVALIQIIWSKAAEAEEMWAYCQRFIIVIPPHLLLPSLPRSLIQVASSPSIFITITSPVIETF
jgi:hypothetical protein